MREAQEEWTKGGEEGGKPKPGAAANTARKTLEKQQRKRLIFPITFTLLAIAAIIAGLIVG